MKTFAVILIAFLTLCGSAFALEPAPLIVTDSTGSPLHVLGTTGYIQNAGAKQMTSTSNWVLQNSAGTTLYTFDYSGYMASLGVKQTGASTNWSVLNSSGVAQHTLTYDGYLKNLGVRHLYSDNTWSVQNSAGTTVAQIDASGFVVTPALKQGASGTILVKTSGGSTVDTIDSSGYIAGPGVKQTGASTSWVVKNSAGTTLSGFHYNGALLCSTDNTSKTDLANGTAGETNETTVTFAVAEPDANYNIIGTLEDSADTTARFQIARKNVGTFVIKSDNINATGYVSWFKTRNP